MTPSSRIAATGLGPRASVGTSASASSKRWRPTCRSVCCTSIRVPTPVISTTASISPAIKRFANSTAGRLSSTGASRIEGLTHATPPCFSMRRVISDARRLSSDTTRRPSKCVSVAEALVIFFSEPRPSCGRRTDEITALGRSETRVTRRDCRGQKNGVVALLDNRAANRETPPSLLLSVGRNTPRQPSRAAALSRSACRTRSRYRGVLSRRIRVDGH